MLEVWVEKYRPRFLSEIVGDAATLQRLQHMAQVGNMPHLLITGPPGTGKTTSVLALARELLGPELMRTAVLELNASDERGIATVRDRIKQFAKEQRDLPPGKHKIVVLDEVDAMTEAAQQALRRLMEVYSDTTRFALACNQSTKIIEPIQSRCAIIRFGRLQDEQILKRLLKICVAEGIDYAEGGLETLIFTAEGDMRNAINNLQSTVNGFGRVSRENVLKVCDVPPPETVKSIIEDCLAGKWRSAHTTCTELIRKGYTPRDVVVVTMSVVKRSSKLSEPLALEYLKILCRGNFTLVDGISSPLQLDAILARLCEVSLCFADSIHGAPAAT